MLNDLKLITELFKSHGWNKKDTIKAGFFFYENKESSDVVLMLNRDSHKITLSLPNRNLSLSFKAIVDNCHGSINHYAGIMQKAFDDMEL